MSFYRFVFHDDIITNQEISGGLNPLLTTLKQLEIGVSPSMLKLIAKVLNAPPTFASIGQDISLKKSSIKLVVASCHSC